MVMVETPKVLWTVDDVAAVLRCSRGSVWWVGGLQQPLDVGRVEPERPELGDAARR